MTSTFQRVATSVDADGSQIITWPCEGARSVALFALANSSGASITVRLLAFTSPNNLAAISPQFVFTGSSVVDFKGQYSGTPNAAVWMPIDGVGLAGVKVDAITGTWVLGATVSRERPCG